MKVMTYSKVNRSQFERSDGLPARNGLCRFFARMVVNSRRIRDFDLLSKQVFKFFSLVEKQHQMVLARSKLRHFRVREKNHQRDS